MKQELRLGTSKVDITPTKPIPLAGFASRIGLGDFEGISRRLFARILLFRHRDENGNETSTIIISADLVWWGSEYIPLLKKRINAQWGVDEAAILFHGTHTHSGPQTSTLFTSLIGKSDSDYLQQLKDAVWDGIGEAHNNLEPVTVERGVGECSIGINRRLPIEQNIELRPNPRGIVDHELIISRFKRVNGVSVKAVLVHYACHPVTTSDNRVSSEFTGVAMELIEEQLGGDSIAAYLQGACGDINPGNNNGFFSGSDREVLELGRILAGEALKVLNAPMKTLLVGTIKAQIIHVELPLQQLPNRTKLELLVGEPGIIGEWSRMLLSSNNPLPTAYLLEMAHISIAKGLSILAMNAEVVVEYGLFVKDLTEGGTLPLGYSNGMIGYLPTAKQLSEGGYESVDSTYYFAMPAPFDPIIERITRDGVVGLLAE